MPSLVKSRRIPVLLAACLLLVALLSSCIKSEDQPQTVAQQFADALNSGDAQRAADLTTDPAASRTTISQAFDALTKQTHFAVAHADPTGKVSFAVDWNLGTPQRNWRFTSTAQAVQSSGNWKITWAPSILVPQLGAGDKLRLISTYAAPARILDNTGAQLMTEQVVTLVNLAPQANATAVAALLNPVVPSITAPSLTGQLAAGKTITAVTLRENDIAPIEAALRAQPGVTLSKQRRLLTTDRDLASPTLNGLADLWQTQHQASAGWSVQAVHSNGSTTPLTGQDPKPTPDITTTLNIASMKAARAAIAKLPQQAAIVAITPSTGALVAIAQNDAADAHGPIALTGLYPPGSTFKIVTSTAALEAGKVTPDTVLACPGSADIEGRTIPNDDNFDLGQVPLHTAFAKSCNTTMARLAVDLPSDALAKAAGQLGLGSDYTIPGATTVTGNVPDAPTAAARVEASIGQGKVTASPFGMALVAATIAHDSVPMPTLIQGQSTTAKPLPAALPAGIAPEIRTMMRETVTAGTATQLRDIPDVLGKTGTAESGAGNDAHGWFVGIRGDLAFAVFIADAGSSTPAVLAAGDFLRANP
ncbi:penicillin-binding protein [Skermania sp. ID1734]|uniref:penicillin-binding transpeptidase domain-containing protein n=1 Tax=Skermania sp. ID1734 TaxID=2597516 RepID=UPI0011811788|nr:penicillin-binding transpeptidase domain-containing protein [Skermania sp. ID1734]TSE00269.1 penicillin-binding protein [Skermania sp. ID1734]